MNSAAIEVVRHPRARRIRLSVDPATGNVRLTLPPRASARNALAWAEGKRDWIDAQRATRPVARPFVDGARLPVDDRLLIIAATPDGPRVPRVDGDHLICGDDPVLPMRIERWLRREALRLLSADSAHYAALAGVRVTRVGIGDPRTRWGSCAADGTLRYNWRLVLAPGWVRRATAAHEVAHRIHMDHSPRFHALVGALFEGDPRAATAWLRANGAVLHSYGRTS